MASTECGWCGRFAHMTPRGGIWHRLDELGETRIVRIMGAYGCDNCGRTTLASGAIALQPIQYHGVDVIPDGDVRGMLDRASDSLKWFPLSATGKRFPDVPAHIADAASEAHKAMQIRAHRAAVLLARAVIEATAKEKGVTTGTLYAKIDEMANRQLIREHIKDGAHEVRYLGNDMAHGDLVDPVDSADAGLVLTLMDEVLQEVFVSPAAVQRARNRRITRQHAGAPQVDN